jgi:hypothetical protein
MIKTGIHTEKIIKGKRNYFIDINKSQNGKLYLKLSESTRGENGFDLKRLIVFEEDINDFADIFQKSISIYKELKRQEQIEITSLAVEKNNKLDKVSMTCRR